jgi:transcriptional regulator with XRE-family HTH domain
MNLQFDKTWLRNLIISEPDVDCEIGVSAVQDQEVAVDEPHSLEVNVLGAVVVQIRRRDRLTVAQLADRVRVDEDEIASIEQDRHFSPEPRTLHQLSTYMKVPAVSLMKLTPDAANADEEFHDVALKFAASSEDLSALSKVERRRLNDFVKFLAKHKGK